MLVSILPNIITGWSATNVIKVTVGFTLFKADADWALTVTATPTAVTALEAAGAKALVASTVAAAAIAMTLF
jgi:hypothetical protein